MKCLVVYDSKFGNTETLAKAMAEALAARDEARALRVTEARPEDLEGVDLLVVGAPTQAFRPSPAAKSYLSGLGDLKGMAVAAFDTRIALADIENGLLRTIVRWAGYAAPHIARALEGQGGVAVVPAEGFLVADQEGPLRDGEIDRGIAWVQAAAEQARGSR